MSFMNKIREFVGLPHNGTDTSVAAAKAALPKAPTDAEVIHAMLKREPLTCHEIEAATGLKHQTASARLRGLAVAKRIIDTGARRSTDSGRMACVWAAA